ncbi:MAG: acyltransferase family protein [Bacteroidales bacterium]|jgi:hypothetical protein|nr:acyltransferase family protein [Bacteroidales bacterium]
MRISPISKTDTLYFKAIGILMIVFHNYFHLIPPRIGENEHLFSQQTIKNLYLTFRSYPLEWVSHLFEYFGHYGVQIFIFISAVGLSYTMLRKPTPYFPYILHRLKSLYYLLIVGIIVYCMTKLVVYGNTNWSIFAKHIGYKFLFIQTLLPHESFSLSGPWWFFGIIFQLYLLFPLLFRIIQKYAFKGFLGICAFSYLCTFIQMYVWHTPAGVHWFLNSIAHLPEFAMGIFFVFHADKKIPTILLVVALILFVLGNFLQLFFPFTFLAITLLLYVVIQKCIVLFNKSPRIGVVFQRIGTLSMALFVVHGTFRNRFYELFSTSWHSKLLGAALFFITVYAVAIIAETLYQWLYSKLTFKK